MPCETIRRLRRSPVYRALEAAGAICAERAGGAIAIGFGESADAEAAVAQQLGLADLTPLPRLGFKGPNALPWLREQGLTFEVAPNRAFEQVDGTLVALLAPTEALLVDGPGGAGTLIGRLERIMPSQGDGGCYPVPRRDSHFCIALTGIHAAAALAKLCGVDLRPTKFAPGAVAQTSVARGSAIVIRHDFGATLGFLILGDHASAEYQWGCLIDAMAEFDGRPVGLMALDRLAAGR